MLVFCFCFLVKETVYFYNQKGGTIIWEAVGQYIEHKFSSSLTLVMTLLSMCPCNIIENKKSCNAQDVFALLTTKMKNWKTYISSKGND